MDSSHSLWDGNRQIRNSPKAGPASQPSDCGRLTSLNTHAQMWLSETPRVKKQKRHFECRRAVGKPRSEKERLSGDVSDKAGTRREREGRGREKRNRPVQKKKRRC